MRKLFIAILAFVAVAAGIAIYFVVTTPKSSAGVRFPLTGAQRALVAQVPQSAESFALIPTAAAFEAKLRANPITRDAVESWEEKHSMPARWMLGGADLLLWRDADGGTHYLVHADPLRSLFVRNQEPGAPLDVWNPEHATFLAACGAAWSLRFPSRPATRSWCSAASRVERSRPSPARRSPRWP